MKFEWWEVVLISGIPCLPPVVSGGAANKGGKPWYPKTSIGHLPDCNNKGEESQKRGGYRQGYPLITSAWAWSQKIHAIVPKKTLLYSGVCWWKTMLRELCFFSSLFRCSWMPRFPEGGEFCKRSKWYYLWPLLVQEEYVVKNASISDIGPAWTTCLWIIRKKTFDTCSFDF